jgi:hypothetical protein
MKEAFLLIVSVTFLLVQSSSYAMQITVNACQDSGLPAPVCNNSCEETVVDAFTCFPDPMGAGSWMFGCSLFDGNCFRFSQRLGSCDGPLLEEGAAMCGQCVEGSKVVCNETGVRRLLCTDNSCNKGCTEVYSVLYGQCTSYTTPNNQVTYITARPMFGKCFALRVGYFNDSFCNSIVGERVANSGECFSTSLNPLDEFSVTCDGWRDTSKKRASTETVQRLAESISRNGKKIV